MAIIGAILGDIAGSNGSSIDQKIWITNILNYSKMTVTTQMILFYR